MTCKIKSFILEGLNAVPITVEVDIHRGLPAIYIIGLGDRAVLESRMRVAAAIRNSGYIMPMSKIVINLAPADHSKYGTALDLPIALGILIASKQFSTKNLDTVLRESAIWGELSLQGATSSVKGAIIIADGAKDAGLKTLCLPKINAKEAGMIAGINILAIESLAKLLEYLKYPEKRINDVDTAKLNTTQDNSYVDFKNIHGQEKVKRALEIAATGNHNVLLSGPPGVGKTMLCQAFCGILPDLSCEEALQVFKIQSVAGLLKHNSFQGFSLARPFRSPHHSATLASIIGGGTRLKPGEITLAHHGVLFFDECNHFAPQILEALREPLEQGAIRLSRNYTSAVLPAKFIFIAAINPCPCGNWGSDNFKCTCTGAEIARFSKRISRPLLDRIEIQVQVERSKTSALDFLKGQESTVSIRKRVLDAKEFQESRSNFPEILNFENLNSPDIFIPKARELLKKAAERLQLSNRELLRLVNVSRSIADLRQGKKINEADVAEAVTYRIQR